MPSTSIASRSARAATLLVVASIATLAACRTATPSSAAPVQSGARTPARIADELLAAERGYAKAAASRVMRDGLGAMFTDGVLMPAPRGVILAGKAPVLAALSATADSTARITWTPIRVGLAADGEHGFTVGFMFATRPDGTKAQYKYLSFWVRDGGTWKVSGWRRRAMDMVAVDSTMLSPLLPERLVAPVRDRVTLAQHLASVRGAEQGFSDTAQRIGVGAAFVVMGNETSVNVGLPTDGRFIVGSPAIARLVAGGQPLDAPSTIVWGADTAVVSSSGDLGMTFGVIRPKAAPAGPALAGSSFLTIWRKAGPGAPWRYVAE